MEYVDLQGARVPKIGLGTWKMRGRACRDVVLQALDIGYRHIDTAQMYENEEDVGAALRMSGIARDDVWITTKLALGHDDERSVFTSIRGSLKKLALPYVDLFLIHWPTDNDTMAETLQALVRVQEEGLTRYIGVSNFTRAQLEAAVRSVPLLGIQLEYHPFLPQQTMLSLASDRDLLFTAYSPLARGGVADDPTLAAIGAEHGKSASQVALRWLIQQTNVSAIPKASSEEHLRENFEVFDFDLTRDEMSRIDRLTQRRTRLADPDFAPRWEEH